MIFAARHRSYSRLDSSPVASGWSRSCSMMKRSIVMTEVDVCTLPIGREGNSAHLVRSEDLTAPTPQPAEHLGCRMAVVIVDRKSTRLNSSHRTISYAVFCLKKKKPH